MTPDYNLCDMCGAKCDRGLSLNTSVDGELQRVDLCPIHLHDALRHLSENGGCAARLRDYLVFALKRQKK